MYQGAGAAEHERRQLRSRFMKISGTETGIESGFRPFRLAKLVEKSR